MTAKQSMNAVNKDRWSYLWLAIGTILFSVGLGKWYIPLAGWLWPIFMLRFIRTQKPLPGLITAALALISCCYIQWSGIVGGTPLVQVSTFVLIGGVLYTAPFVFDRLIAHRLRGVLSTLIFPLALVAVEYGSSFSPNGPWCSIAYSQYGNLPLQQLVSITGIYGITFLVAWSAAVVNAAWENEFEWPKIRKMAGFCACILAIIILCGGARLAFFPPEAKTVRVASIVAPPGDNIITLLASREQRQIPPVEKTIAIMENLSAKGAQAGAKIVNWNELSLRVSESDEAAFIDSACKLALKEKIYLLLAICIFPEKPGSLATNKLVFIDPSGKVQWQYIKNHPVPQIEEPYVVPGDNKIPISDTPYGKIAAVICFDADFPAFIRQAGQAGANLLFVPSEDWEPLLTTHTQMMTFRAIENGFSLVRCTYEGLTMAVDHQGRTLTAVNYFRTNENVIISDVPMKGVTTIYSKIGDLFAWLCCAGFVIIVVLALLRRRAVETPTNAKQ